MSERKVRLRYRPSTYVKLLSHCFTGVVPGFKRLLHFMARVLPGGFGLRPVLHRLRGVKIGDNVWIGDDVYLDDDFPESVEIHEGAAIATRCTIITHAKGSGKVIIGKDAAIGAGSVIVCSSGRTLTIGEGAVVSAGSTVTHDIPPYTLCGAPRLKTFGKITVPFRVATTLGEFRRGVTPLRATNVSTESRMPVSPS
jgi:UDP-3-O-[3-hydroxymyristoyl] glucosamine N-acyltransferase